MPPKTLSKEFSMSFPLLVSHAYYFSAPIVSERFPPAACGSSADCIDGG